MVSDVVVPRRGAKSRVIYLDDTEWRTTSADVVSALGIRTGASVEVASLEDRLAVEEPLRARERALRLLVYRDRSVQELRARLVEDGYPEDVAVAVASRLESVGLLDDVRFAGATARVLTQTRGRGRAHALRELAAKGIDPEVALAAVDEALPADDEADAAATVARAFARKPGATVAKIAARLARRGYAIPIALAAARRVLGDVESDTVDGDIGPYEDAPDLHE
jgi:regulatory protein